MSRPACALIWMAAAATPLVADVLFEDIDYTATGTAELAVTDGALLVTGLDGSGNSGFTANFDPSLRVSYATDYNSSRSNKSLGIKIDEDGDPTDGPGLIVTRNAESAYDVRPSFSGLQIGEPILFQFVTPDGRVQQIATILQDDLKVTFALADDVLTHQFATFSPDETGETALANDSARVLFTKPTEITFQGRAFLASGAGFATRLNSVDCGPLIGLSSEITINEGEGGCSVGGSETDEGSFLAGAHIDTDELAITSGGGALTVPDRGENARRLVVVKRIDKASPLLAGASNPDEPVVIEIEAFGRFFNDEEDSSLGSLTCQAQNTQLRISYDYGSLAGVSGARVELYSRGARVGSETLNGASGVAARLSSITSEDPPLFLSCDKLGGLGQTPCYRLTFAESVSFASADGSKSIDEIRILTEGFTGQLNEVRNISYQFQNLKGDLVYTASSNPLPDVINDPDLVLGSPILNQPDLAPAVGHFVHGHVTVLKRADLVNGSGSSGGSQELVYLQLENGAILPAETRQALSPSLFTFAHPLPITAGNGHFDIASVEQKVTGSWTSRYPQLLPSRRAVVTVGAPVAAPETFPQAIPARASSPAIDSRLHVAQNNGITLAVADDAPNRATVDIHATLLIGEGDEQRMVTLISEDTNGACYGGPGEWLKLIGDIVLCGIEELVDLGDFQLQIDDGHVTVLKLSTGQPAPLAGNILVTVKNRKHLPALSSAKIPTNWNTPNANIVARIASPAADLLGGALGMPDGSGGLLGVAKRLDQATPLLYRGLNFTGDQRGLVLAPQVGAPITFHPTSLTLIQVETDSYPWLAAIPGVIPLGPATEHHGLGFPGNEIPIQPSSQVSASKKGYDYYKASSDTSGAAMSLPLPTGGLPDNVVAQISIGMFTQLGVQCPDPLIPDCVLMEDYSALSSGPVLFQGENSLSELQLRIPEIIRCGFPGWKTRMGGDDTLLIWKDDASFNPATTQLTLTFTQIEGVAKAPFVSIPGRSSYGQGDVVELVGAGDNTSTSHGGTLLNNVAEIGRKLVTRAGIAGPTDDNTLVTDTGIGNSGYIYPTVSGVNVPHPGRVFVGRLDRRLSGNETIPRTESELPPGVTYFYSQNDEPCLVIDFEWCAGAIATLEGSFELSDGTVVNFSFPEIIFEESGDSFDCVEKLRDIAGCGITQLNGNPTGLVWNVSTLANGQIKLAASALNADVEVTGEMSLCIRCTEDIAITSVTQKDCFKKGDEICFEMTGISPEPDALCVMLATTPPIPLDVIDILPTGVDGVFKVIAIINGAPDELSAVRICVTSGLGRSPQWSPMVNIRVDEPGTVWFGRSAEMVKSREQIVIKPDPTTPPINEICLVDEITGDEDALCFDLTGPFPADTQVKISGHLYIEPVTGDAITYDIQEPVISTFGASTAEEMCVHLLDIIRCQLTTAGFIPDLELKCPDDGDGDPNTATFKICHNGDGNFQGYLKILFCLPTDDPIIDDPTTDDPVGNNEIIVITGCHFGDNPKNISVLAVGPQGSFPLTVLMVSDKEIVVSTGDIPAAFADLTFDIQVTVGSGDCNPIVLPGDGVIATPVTGFTNSGGGNTGTLTGGLTVKPDLEVSGLKTQLLATTTNGQISLPINFDWTPGLAVSVDFSGYINNDPNQVVAMHIPRIDFPNGGTAHECAIELAITINSAMTQLGLVPNLNVGVSGPDTTFILSNPGYPALEPLTATLSICLIRPPAQPVITGVPAEITIGQPFLIAGTFPGEAAEYFAYARNSQGSFIRLGVVSLGDGGMTASIAADSLDNDCDGDDDFYDIHVIHTNGNGGVGEPFLAFDDIAIGNVKSHHLPSGIQMAVAPNQSEICLQGDPPAVRQFVAEIVDGKFCLFLRGDWTADSPIMISMIGKTECDSFSFEANDVLLGGDGTAADCAARLKDVIRCAFIQQTGVGLHLDCEVIPGTNTVKLTFQLDSEKPLLDGYFVICTAIPLGGDDADPDGDGLTNRQEENIGTDALDPDSDGDGLLDGQEVALNTNPMFVDSDRDGEFDGAELAAGTDPLDPRSKLVLTIQPEMADGGDLGFSFTVPKSVQGIVYELKRIDMATAKLTSLPGFTRVGTGNDLQFDLGIVEADPKDFFIATAR